VKIDKLSRD